MKRLLFTLIIVAGYYQLRSQKPACGHETIQLLQKQNFPFFEEENRLMNLKIKNFVEEEYGPHLKKAQSAGGPGTFTIPVVFHIVHSTGDSYGSGANISYSQILSQLNAMNAAFSKSYPTYNGQSHPAYAQNTQIEFCLARSPLTNTVSFYNGPQGIEYGVRRYANNALTNHQMSLTDAASLKNLTHPTMNDFPFESYLNIWVVTSLNGAVGYAPMPIMGSYPLDGVVIRSDVVGDNSTNNNFALGFGLQQGKVMVHELGHYFNLLHIFEGGCSGANSGSASSDQCDLNGDCICDIEPCTTQNISCVAPVPNSCAANYAAGTTTLDMVESYMSYADDDCMNTFTMGQTQRMWANLKLTRTTLWQYSNLALTGVMSSSGCIAPTLYSDIQTIYTSNCTNSLITLSNPLLGNTATSWTWTTPGANISSANTSSISISYPAAGLHKVKLRVSDGTSFILDSVNIFVNNCTLDSTKKNRSNFLFGIYCALNFSTGVPVVTNVAMVNNTIKCAEMAVSMSDSTGNLLFYSNGRDLWDNNHTKINTGPLLGWDLNLAAPNGYGGTSVAGFMSFPVPRSSTKYYLICMPPLECKSNFSQGPLAKICYAIYDVATKTVSPYQCITHPSLYYGWQQNANTGTSENMCVVPHCNGVDYWVITRGFDPSNVHYFYSFLATQAGISTTATPVLSGPFPASEMGETSDFKSNSTGTKLVTKAANTNIPYMYDFNATTGIVSNSQQLPSSYTTSGVPYPKAIIFSPNDQFIYSHVGYAFDVIDVASKTIVKTMSPSGFFMNVMSYSEVGPDNNIYFTALKTGSLVLGQISNPNSAISSTVNSVVSFSTVTGSDPINSLVNYMEAKKPVELEPLKIVPVACNSYSFSLDPCWDAVYTATLNFGDGSPVVATNNTTHVYTTPGIYTVSLQLSHKGLLIPPVTQTIQVAPSTLTITGPTVICNGSSFPNNYGVNPLPGAIYSWSVSNGSIAGPANLSNVNVLGNTSGPVTISVAAGGSGYCASGSKTIAVANLPNVTLNPPSSTLCVNQVINLTGNPPGGTFSGAASSASFSSNVPGSNNIMYTYFDSSGCYKNTAASVLVQTCTGLNGFDGADPGFFPNPVSTELYVSSAAEIKSYHIFNALGEEIRSGAFEPVLRVTELSPGVYYINLIGAVGEQRRFKFVKE